MRDPAGRVRIEGEWAVRTLREDAGRDHFLRSELAARWVERGDLIPFEWIDSKSLRSPVIKFVTYPSTWSAVQFRSAARLTLRLQSEAVAAGWDMKDASAWNIVFDGLCPIFVDLLSFERLEHKLWAAAGQFARHFITPLLLEKEIGIEAHQSLKIWRDGVPPEIARQALGYKRFFTRCWPVLAAANRRAGPYDPSSSGMDLPGIVNFRSGLHVSLGWMLEGLDGSKRPKGHSIWADYESERAHYECQAITRKREVLQLLLSRIRPEWALDLGSNAGEFSEIAVACGAKVICWDGDSRAVGNLCARHLGSREYFPIIAPIDDIPAGRGWMAREYQSLADQLEKRVDVVMMLAILHHLYISAGVGLEEVFKFAKHVSRGKVIAEMISHHDPKVLQLCRHFGRNPQEFSISRQYEAAEAVGLTLEERMELDQSGNREIALFSCQ